MTPSVKMSSEYELNSSRKCVVLVKRPYSERALDSRLLTHVFTQFGAHPKAVTLLDSCPFLGLHSTTQIKVMNESCPTLNRSFERYKILHFPHR